MAESIHIPTTKELITNKTGRTLFIIYVVVGVAMLWAYFQPKTIPAIGTIIGAGVIYSIT